MALLEEEELQGNWLFKYRGVLPVIILFIGGYLYLHAVNNPEKWTIEGTRFEIVYETFCLFVSLLGLSIRIYTVGYTRPNSSGRNTKTQVADGLNTTGIYSIIRHPLYVGNFFMWLGIAMLTANFWFIMSFILLFWLYYERIMLAEEQYLRRKFGEPFLTWANHTPAIIPAFRQFRKPAVSFNWKKVVRNEKTGFMLLFLIFSLFDFWGEWLKSSRQYNFFLMAAAISSCIIYIGIKILSRYTNLLNDEYDEQRAPAKANEINDKASLAN